MKSNLERFVNYPVKIKPIVSELELRYYDDEFPQIRRKELVHIASPAKASHILIHLQEKVSKE